jgi:hypothetical protein
VRGDTSRSNLEDTVDPSQESSVDCPLPILLYEFSFFISELIDVDALISVYSTSYLPSVYHLITICGNKRMPSTEHNSSL